MSPDPGAPAPFTPAGPPRIGAPHPAATPWRARLYRVIYEADTPSGKAFDVALLALIVLSVLTVMLESVGTVREDYGTPLRILEWGFTLAFTLEYVLRLICVRNPVNYALSFFGLVDLLALLPTWLSIVLPGGQSLIVVRFLRLLRIFKVFKLAEYLYEAHALREAMVASRRKIAVFFMLVMTLVVIIGAVMYLVEGESRGFTSIPKSVYWAIVTLTTVGFGDITPQTPLGQFLASVVMLIGYSIIAVPTGIVTAEMTRAGAPRAGRDCPACGLRGHDLDARFCRGCGAALPALTAP